jgi:hypothetical protein
MENQNEVAKQEPNAAVVDLKVLQATVQYLNSRPRGEVNNLATALENSKLVTLESKPQEPVADAPGPKVVKED